MAKAIALDGTVVVEVVERERGWHVSSTCWWGGQAFCDDKLCGLER